MGSSVLLSGGGQAFSRWREEHAATAAAVHTALAAFPVDEGSLRALVDEARSQLWGLFQVCLPSAPLPPGHRKQVV